MVGDWGSDLVGAFRHSGGFDEGEFKAVFAVNVFVDLFEAEGFFECDSASVGVSDEPKIADEENPVLIDCLFLNTFEFICKKR